MNCKIAYVLGMCNIQMVSVVKTIVRLFISTQGVTGVIKQPIPYITAADFDGPSWIQCDLFRKNKLPGSKSRQSLYSL